MQLPESYPLIAHCSNNEPSLEQKIKSLESIDHSIPSVIIVMNIADLSVVYMSKLGQEILGVNLEEIKELGPDYSAAFFNPEDAAEYAPKIVEAITSPGSDKIASYFQQVRSSPTEDWKWYHTCSRVFMRDKEGKATHLISIASSVDPEHHITSKVNRLLEEKNFRRSNQEVFMSLTKREKQLLTLFALGKTSAEIAGDMHLSEQTVNTHRRNIRIKINAQSNYDLTIFAQAFDPI